MVSARNGFSLGFLLLGFLLLMLNICWSISLYDVIQLSKSGYSENRIIELIKVTQSRFQLDAAGMVALKKAGVTEKVIKAVIEASEPPTSGTRASPQENSEVKPSTPASPHQHFHEPHEAEESEQAEEAQEVHEPLPSSTKTPEESRSLTPLSPTEESRPLAGSFSYYVFEEAGAGHGNPHQHCAVGIYDIAVFVLRSEEGHRSVQERAKEVTDLLNRIVGSPEGRFLASGEPDAAVWYRPGPAKDPVRILTVTPGDVIAYQRRSLGHVSAERLAAYWAALLNDYTQLFLFGRAPGQLVQLHLGETLSRIYQDLASPPEEESESASDPGTKVLKILDHLSPEDKDHLIELAMRIPVEFREEREIAQ